VKGERGESISESGIGRKGGGGWGAERSFSLSQLKDHIRHEKEDCRKGRGGNHGLAGGLSKKRGEIAENAQKEERRQGFTYRLQIPFGMRKKKKSKMLF